MLGTVERDQVVRLAQLLAAADTRALLEYASSLDELSPDYAQLLEQLAALCERVALRQLVPGYEGDELHPADLLADLGGRIAPEDVQLFYQTAILGRRDLPLAPDPRTGFRMTLIRMLAFRPASASAPAATPAAAGSVRPPSGTPAPRAAGQTPNPGTKGLPAADASADWSAILAALELQGAPRQLAAQCVLRSREGATWRLALDPRSASLRTRALEDKLARALSRHVGAPVRLEIELAGSAVSTPARLQEQLEAEQQARARVAFDTDPTVGEIRERFGASVLAESVRPVRQDEG
jgi:DNA polymerase-3 subunit gamma/tau